MYVISTCNLFDIYMSCNCKHVLFTRCSVFASVTEPDPAPTACALQIAITVSHIFTFQDKRLVIHRNQLNKRCVCVDAKDLLCVQEGKVEGSFLCISLVKLTSVTLSALVEESVISTLK